MGRKPYLDFYDQYGPGLVSRQIGDADKFFRTRESLFVALGLPPGYIQGKTVLEFGPGAGHNAICTYAMKPSRYVLVDGNREILNECKDTLHSLASDPQDLEFVCSSFSQYRAKGTFDLVIAEGCVPNQPSPEALFLQMLKHVKPGGLMIVTTISAASWLSEIVRRLSKMVCISNSAPIEDQVETMVRKLSKHFESLHGMMRSPHDWVLDNLFQPLDGGPLFSIPDLARGLSGEFMVAGLSPDFRQDWRWYREIRHGESQCHEDLVDRYYKNVINFLDRRIASVAHTRSIGEEVESTSENIWELMRHLEDLDSSTLDNILLNLRDLSKLVSKISPATSESISEACDWISNECVETEMQHFPSWWGRGQQHVGIYRRLS